MAPRKMQGNVRKVTAKRRLPLSGKRHGLNRCGSKNREGLVSPGGGGKRNRREGHISSGRNGPGVPRPATAAATAPILNRTVSTVCREPHSPSTVTTDGSIGDDYSR